MNDSEMKFEQLLFPFILMNSEQWGGQAQAIVDSAPARFQTIREGPENTAKAWVRLDTSTAERREIFIQRQLTYFDALQELVASEEQDEEELELTMEATAIHDWAVLCDEMASV
jgi:hypothetical protein